MRRVLALASALLKNWTRSRSGLLFSLLLPVVLFAVFGGVFGGSPTLVVHVENLDVGPDGAATPLSLQVLNELRTAGVDLRPVSSGSGKPLTVVIPAGFQDSQREKPLPIQVQAAEGDPRGPLLLNLAAGVLARRQTQGTTAILDRGPPGTSSRGIPYYLPALLAAFLLANGTIGLPLVAGEARRRRILTRLSTTPLQPIEWVAAHILTQAVLNLALTLVLLLLASLLFQAPLQVRPDLPLWVLLGSILFSGMGMAIAGRLRDVEAASSAGNAIALPLMFLSGTFWPIEAMPPPLEQAAHWLPLAPLAQGMRAAIFGGELEWNPAWVAFALLLLLLGTWATKWGEE
ncbi:MAG: ABC transporter permease [Euryarchaeota archaeon]|nr:ABC transporter permease [Euryarchaeota archaeon]